MTPLATELHSILSSANAPMKTDSMIKVLFCTGFVNDDGESVSVKQINTTIEEMMASGKIERVWRRGAATYRTMSKSRLVAE